MTLQGYTRRPTMIDVDRRSLTTRPLAVARFSTERRRQARARNKNRSRDHRRSPGQNHARKNQLGGILRGRGETHSRRTSTPALERPAAMLEPAAEQGTSHASAASPEAQQKTPADAATSRARNPGHDQRPELPSDRQRHSQDETLRPANPLSSHADGRINARKNPEIAA